ncbi:MAG: PIN domain-containing protein [Acidimicrobiia bacterium]|nr:PIN domain-containing protein [Acidimicrobiia bacterium]
MSVAYVDTSAVVAVVFHEPGARTLSRALSDFSRLLSSSLLEAELRSTFAREGVEFGEQLLSSIDWILPDRPLSREFNAVLASIHRFDRPGVG